MNVMDAKVIHTKYGMEMFYDNIKSVEIKEIHSPTLENPFYEVLIGVEFFLMKERSFYGMENYFWISMSTDFQTIKIRESEKGNLFGLKDDEEKKATRELLGDWLIKTSSFKNAITEIISRQEYKDSTETEKFFKESPIFKFERYKKCFYRTVKLIRY